MDKVTYNQADSVEQVEQTFEGHEDSAGTIEQPTEAIPETTEKVSAPASEGKFDPNKLTPELQTVYKQIQADGTKKYQEAATLRKQAEGAMEKVKVFDELLANPEFQEWLTAKRSGKLPQEKSSQEELENMTEEQRIQHFAQKIANEKFRELEKQIAPVKDFQNKMVADREIDECLRVYGDDFWKQYDAIQTKLSDPRYQQVPLKDLYELVVSKDRESLGRQKALDELTNKKAASSPRPGGSSATIPSGKAKTMMEAAMMAMQGNK